MLIENYLEAISKVDQLKNRYGLSAWREWCKSPYYVDENVWTWMSQEERSKHLGVWVAKRSEDEWDHLRFRCEGIYDDHYGISTWILRQTTMN